MITGPRRFFHGTPFALGLIALLAPLYGCGHKDSPPPPAESPRNVRVLTLQEIPFAESFEISGPVRPVRGTDVSSEEEGTVSAVVNDKGSEVVAGDVLVELDRRLLAAEMESARATLERQQYNLDKQRQLFEAGKISRLELLGIESEYAQAKARSETVRIRYERAAIRAPFSGLVADRYVEPGQLVLPGTPVARVIDPFTLKVVGALTEREIAWVREGAAAEVLLDGSERPVAGSVGWLGFEADPLSGKFKIEIHIDNPDLELRSGVVGRARLLKKDHGRVLAIPRDCVLTHADRDYVFVVQADTAAARSVVLGVDQGPMVMVTAGLSAGDRVVVRGQRDLVAGARVQVTEQVEAADGSSAADPAVVKSPGADLRDRQGRKAGE